jgi:prepilin-type N-terminal cleavage/methylation domain-containing protein
MMPHKQKQHSLQSSQAGFTIIESLLAIIVVTILMVAIAPVIAMSVAARVQAKRVERATEAAKTYIDGVRSGGIQAVPPLFKTTSPSFLDKAPPPTQFATKVDWSIKNKSGVYCVDLDQKPDCDKNSSRDLQIQAFRTPSPTGPDDPAQGYRLGVRVYRADAFKGSGPSKTTKEQAALKGTLGARDVPLATMITELGPTGKKYPNSLTLWCDRLKNSQVPTKKNSTCDR